MLRRVPLPLPVGVPADWVSVGVPVVVTERTVPSAAVTVVVTVPSALVTVVVVVSSELDEDDEDAPPLPPSADAPPAAPRALPADGDGGVAIAEPMLPTMARPSRKPLICLADDG
jgi:hypothetical protein